MSKKYHIGVTNIIKNGEQIRRCFLFEKENTNELYQTKKGKFPIIDVPLASQFKDMKAVFTTMDKYVAKHDIHLISDVFTYESNSDFLQPLLDDNNVKALKASERELESIQPRSNTRNPIDLNSDNQSVKKLKLEEELEYGCPRAQTVYLDGEEVFHVYNLCECPEDAMIGRDLFDANQFLDALKLGIELGRKGYSDIEFTDKNREEELEYEEDELER